MYLPIKTNLPLLLPPRPSSSTDAPDNPPAEITKRAVGGRTVTVEFTVHCSRIRPWEYIFVCGSHEKLGEWSVERAVEMWKSSSKDPSKWRASIEIGVEDCRNLLRFRYFIGYYLQSGIGVKKTLIVSRWESQHRARCILPSVEAHNGACRVNHVDEFGFYGGKSIITDGWLSNVDQQSVLLRIRGEALNFYKVRDAERSYHVKVTPFDVRHREVGEDDLDNSHGTSNLPLLPSFSATEVANLLADEDCIFHEQPIHGKHFRNNKDFFVFKTQSVSVENLAFRIELFSNAKSSCDSSSNTSGVKHERVSSNGYMSEPLERFAIVYCMPASIPNTYGKVLLPILTKSHQPVGQLKVDYLFVNALPIPQSIETTFARHWKKRCIPVEVGHRGMGISYTKFSAVRENTVDSMNHAAKNGADFVEFDVQLSKDKVPVIFHDFHVLISVAHHSANHLEPKLTTKENSQLTLSVGRQRNECENKKKISSDEFHEISVKDLLLRQLRLLHMHHRAAVVGELNNENSLSLINPHEAPACQPFPKLVDALKDVDMNIGFNIEVKYPMNMVDGTTECDNFFERNEYLDKILQVVLEFGGTRRIVFSSFEPDICAMIALKQTKYPVLFLCIGRTVRYVQYDDDRSASSRVAVNFARGFNLLGVNFHSEDLLVDSVEVKRAHDHGLVSFVWGEDLEKHENIEYFRKKVLVDGLIYDGIGEREPRQNIFVVEREAKLALFDGRRGQSPTRSRTPSFDTLKDAIIAGVTVADASTHLKKAIRNMQHQNQKISKDKAIEKLAHILTPT